MGALEELREISRLCRSNDAWRSETVNLIASENVLSGAARRLRIPRSTLRHRIRKLGLDAEGDEEIGGPGLG